MEPGNVPLCFSKLNGRTKGNATIARQTKNHDNQSKHWIINKVFTAIKLFHMYQLMRETISRITPETTTTEQYRMSNWQRPKQKWIKDPYNNTSRWDSSKSRGSKWATNRSGGTDEQTTPRIPGVHETNKMKVYGHTQRTQGSQRNWNRNHRIAGICRASEQIKLS